MKEFLKISIVQADLFWLDKKKNINLFNSLLEKVEETDVILLPEMFNTSFFPSKISLAEDMDGNSVEWMGNLASEKKCSVAGSLMIKENNNIFNRLIWISSNGECRYYDKRHLFSLAKEDMFLTKGNSRLIVSEQGWNICPMICYDLRFPVFCRNNDEYDILLFLSNWPQKRIDAWTTLLKARAIENQCISIGVNRVGTDNANFLFTGQSSVYNVFGKEILNLSNRTNIVETVTLSRDNIALHKRQMNFLKDRDSFTIHK